MRRWVFILCLLPNIVLAAHLSRSQSDFIQQLLPAIKSTNENIRAQRQQVLRLEAAYQTHKRLSIKKLKTLADLSSQYDLKRVQIKSAQFWAALKDRINTIPTSLVLAQAINESAWGRSRFAKRGLNFFGQWCFEPGCGIVPSRRPKGAHYEVKRFHSVSQSVASYFHNMNTNAAYRSLRAIRGKNQLASATELADGLLSYSTRKGAYVRSIKSIIKHYKLSRFDAK